MINNELNKYLDSKDKYSLEKEILELYELFSQVKKFYNLKLNGECKGSLLKEYKERIKNEFESNLKLDEIKNSSISGYIREFNSQSSDKTESIELMLFYVELSLEYSKNYYQYEEFYLNVESVFDKALKSIFKYKLEDKFKKRLGNIIKTSQEINRNFKNDLLDIYSLYV